MKTIAWMGATLLTLAIGTSASAGPRARRVSRGRGRPAQAGDVLRGEKLFTTTFALGKPETPSCTSCHGKTPFTRGETRTGKVIEPMAISKTPDRYTDPKKVAKWFRQNCNGVLGRECTPQEKLDFLTYMSGQ